VEGIKNRIFRRIKRFKRVMKILKIRIQPLRGEYIFWVLYLFFEEEDCGSFLCMILYWMWLRKFSWVKNYVCEIEDRGGIYGNILYFDSYNRKWLKVYHIVFILFYLEDVK
jgi:hypothetical protein